MDDSALPSIFNDLVNGMNKEVHLFRMYRTCRVHQEEHSLATLRKRAKVAEDVRKAQAAVFADTLHSLRCLTVIAGIHLDYEMTGGLHCIRAVSTDISLLSGSLVGGLAWVWCLLI